MTRPLRLLPALVLLASLHSPVITAQQPAPPVPSGPAQADAPHAPAQDAFTVDENVVYGTVDGHNLQVDIYRPAAITPRPAVILIHGGGWTTFDKSTMRTMASFLAREGFACFAVDYRLFHNGQNRWPAQLDDVQRAVRWIRANAQKYNVDPNHIGAFGHSAGAQLAALLGMMDTRDNSDPTLARYSSRVQAVVDVSGPTDFTQRHDAGTVAFFTSFLGADPGAHPEVWQQASPAFHVAKDNAPFLILHGTQDPEVPIAQSQELADKLKAAGVPVTFVQVDDVHTFRTPEARHRLAFESLEFFRRNLGSK
jgi:acetyl esterase/lipase